MNSSTTSESAARAGVDYPGVTCVFVCHDGVGNVLLHRRSQRARDERGRWDTGAGALALGESFEQAVEREIREEYGALPRDIEFLDLRNVLRADGELTTHWVAIYFAVRIEPAEAVLGEPEKFDAIEWFPLTGSLPEPQHSQLHVSIAALRRHLASEA